MKDPATREPFPDNLRIGVQIGQEALRQGLIIRYDSHWFALAPPLVVTQEELDEMMAILGSSISAVLERL